MEQYKVTCNKCKGSDTIKITPDRQVFYSEHTPILSARYRPDMQWGFECVCGNYSLIAPEEKNALPKIVKNASEPMIKQLAKTLTVKNELKFEMVKL